ncbi:MAG: hypothetical protein HXX12_07260 [Geothrix sp.]|uniref:hypothetical protein n=1 Tax=Geothrix sp. TaxID=1962974 RepID=UPI0017F1A816|nr:hypothetical protein [Geothrix sp.]NWJ40754.1 hypothetical protein [Geothrix sp.]WIL21240.1 MAG: hypothetical protein QOZ81_000493 [Geothrix sp.]
MTRFLFGQILILFLVILTIAMIGGRAVIWLHPAPWAFLLVLVVPLVAVLSAHPWSAFRQALRDALHPSASLSNGTSAKVWKLAESCLYFGATIAFFMGLMITFSLLSGDLHNLGAKLAACLAPPFFSVVLGLSCRILRARVEAVA